MIRKPDAGWDGGDDRLVESARQFGGAASNTLSAAASGVVRVRAAYSAVVTAIMAVMVGVAALAALGSARNLPMAMLAGCFSVVLGWLALWNFRKAFGSAQQPRAEAQWTPEMTDPVGLRAAGQVAGWASQNGETLPSGDTTSICYDRTKIFLHAAKLFLACIAMAAVMTRAPHTSPALDLIFLVAMGFVLWHLFSLLLKATGKDLRAISWNNRQIQVRTLAASCQVPWASLESVVVKRNTVKLLRLIPIHTTYTLMFQLRHNGSSRKMNVPASVLDIRSRDIMDLMRKIELRRAQYARNPMADIDQRFVGTSQTVNPSFRGAGQADTASAADPVRRTQDFETCEPIPTAPVAFGRKVS
jgi:hypothetical protein